jgi:sulfide-quinone reductase (EC 1.-.-.-)
LATGPKLAFDEVKGLGPDGHSVSICTTAHAEVARQNGKNSVQVVVVRLQLALFKALLVLARLMNLPALWTLI